MEIKSVMICGVGGQGILLASDLLSQTMLETGMDVKKSEVHGMSQRGGTVVSSIRYGEKVFSPLIGKGDVDILLAFEKLEGLRQLEFLKEKGIVIINDFVIVPLPVACGLAEYPEDVISVIKNTVPDAVVIDGLSLAKKAGNARSMNIVLLGLLAKKLKIDRTLWYRVIEKRVPKKTWKVNKKAFDLGYESN
ncbi:MAG: indolepyruvate oxidoreductase subunit beta [Candidatus Cloacimonadota bacterium]|nr:MAG: indolepyruvate oxidoreductase subunit beta [Candidatus Cloacimonadota bacterium]